MGRPAEPSPRTIRLLLEKLLTDTLWIGNWKSTGIGSRNTVHKGLGFLEEKGLITSEREGHKILYKIVKDENVTPEMIEAGFLSFRISEWMPYLLTERGIKSLSRTDSRTEEWARVVIERIKRNQGRLMYYVRRRDGTTIFDREEVSNESIITRIEEVFPEKSDMRVLATLEQIIHIDTCWECLENKGVLSHTIHDPETGEYVCQSCGIIIFRDGRTV